MCGLVKGLQVNEAASDIFSIVGNLSSVLWITILIKHYLSVTRANRPCSVIKKDPIQDGSNDP